MIEDRQGRAHGTGAGTVWITGLSASGKSTLACALYASLSAGGLASALLIDGEYMRARLGNRYGHSLADREAVLHHIVDEAERAHRAGRLVIVATISHTRSMRAQARARLRPFLEVYLACPAAVCAARDSKGHYARAARGEYECFIGVTDPYEPWQESPYPELTLDTAGQGPGESMALLSAAVQRRFELRTLGANQVNLAHGAPIGANH